MPKFHFVASFCFIWPHLASFGFIWLHLGFIWLHLASFGRAAGAPNCDAPLLQDRPRTSISNRRQADHSLGVPLLQQDLICAHRAGNTNLESPAGGSQPGRSIRLISPLFRSKRFCVQQNRCPSGVKPRAAPYAKAGVGLGPSWGPYGKEPLR